MRLVGRARTGHGLAHGVQAVEHLARLIELSLERQLRVFVHPLVVHGLQVVGRRRTQIQLPVHFDNVVQPFGFRRRGHMDFVAHHGMQAPVHLARNGVFDRHDVGQFGDARAFIGLHEIAAVGMAPHGDADVRFLANRLVVLVQHFAAIMHEAQHRGVDHDVIRAAGLGVQRQFQNSIEVLVRHRHDRSGFVAAFIHRNFEVPFALLQRHGEKLSLLARNEQALNVQIVDPVTNIRAQPRLIQQEIVIKRIQCRSPDPAHMFPRVILRILLGVFHGLVLTVRFDPNAAWTGTHPRFRFIGPSLAAAQPLQLARNVNSRRLHGQRLAEQSGIPFFDIHPK